MSAAFRKDGYAWMAPIYDSAVEPAMGQLRRDICTLAQRYRCEKVLDIGCGTGRQAVMLAGAGFRVAGVDSSAAMLERARKNGPGQVEFYLEDSSRLPFPSSSFDCAILSLSLHEQEATSRRNTMLEALRILSPGGKLITLDHVVRHTAASRISHPFIEFLERIAGREHHRHFREFIKAGGLEPFLIRFPLKTLCTRTCLLDTMALIVSEKS